jgi:hypothetical protein
MEEGIAECVADEPWFLNRSPDDFRRYLEVITSEPCEELCARITEGCE